MNNILIYTRLKKLETVAEQTAHILSQQLQQIGLNVEVCNSLNLPRLILNSYQTVHFIVESLPLNVNEVFHLAVCKALGKATILSVLNSEKKITKSFLDFISPDAFSVSQTNHLKLYRNLNCNKFIFSAFPKTDGSGKKTIFKHEAYLIPIENKLDEVFQFHLDSTVYFDGRKLLNKYSSSQLRKKWNELVLGKKIPPNHLLILSENKILQLLSDEALSVVTASPNIIHTEFIRWLSLSMNKNNLIVLNEFQATGFSNYWTSGGNCRVLSTQDWIKELESGTENQELVSSNYKTADLLEPTVNELSRLYSKILHQKTSLLTSGSVKL